MRSSVEAARQEISGLIADPPPGGLLADAAIAALGRLVGHDGYCLFGVDPVTGLRSVMFARHGLTAPTEVLLHNETAEQDANRYSDLVRAAVPVGVLSPTRTRGSRRLHEILPADGYGGELRLALTTPGRYWGALSLFRCKGQRPFGDPEVTAAHELAPLLGQVLRRYQVGRPAPRPAARAPLAGVICLDVHGSVVGMDDEARVSLTALSNDWRDGVVPEDVLRCVHEVARAARQRRAAQTRTRLGTAAGWW